MLSRALAIFLVASLPVGCSTVGALGNGKRANETLVGKIMTSLDRKEVPFHRKVRDVWAIAREFGADKNETEIKASMKKEGLLYEEIQSGLVCVDGYLVKGYKSPAGLDFDIYISVWKGEKDRSATFAAVSFVPTPNLPYKDVVESLRRYEPDNFLLQQVLLQEALEKAAAECPIVTTMIVRYRRPGPTIDDYSKYHPYCYEIEAQSLDPEAKARVLQLGGEFSAYEARRLLESNLDPWESDEGEKLPLSSAPSDDFGHVGDLSVNNWKGKKIKE